MCHPPQAPAPAQVRRRRILEDERKREAATLNKHQARSEGPRLIAEQGGEQLDENARAPALRSASGGLSAAADIDASAASLAAAALEVRLEGAVRLRVAAISERRPSCATTARDHESSTRRLHSSAPPSPPRRRCAIHLRIIPVATGTTAAMRVLATNLSPLIASRSGGISCRPLLLRCTRQTRPPPQQVAPSSLHGASREPRPRRNIMSCMSMSKSG